MSKITTTLTTKLELDNSEFEISNNDGVYTLVVCNKFLMEHVSIVLSRGEMQQVTNLLSKGGV